MDLPISAVILGGGFGARLGHIDKAFIRNSTGQELWAQTVNNLSEFADESLLVVRPEQEAKFRQAMNGASDLNQLPRIVLDQGQGPAAALIHAATVAENECLLVVGVDHPIFDESLVVNLRSRWTAKVSGVAVRRREVPDSSPFALQPLWALYRRSVVNTLGERDDWAGRPLVELLGILAPEVFDFRSEAFKSVNIPAELHAFDCTIQV